MAEIKVDTANIPKHISDALCEDLLKSMKEYIRNNPGAAEALEERGRALFQRIAAKKAQEAQATLENK